MLLAILVGQEFIFTSLPGVQLTVIFVIVIAQFLTYEELIPLMVGYSILDNLLMGSLNMVYFPTHLIIWLGFALLMRRMRHQKDYIILIVATVYSFLMGFAYLPASIFMMHLDSWEMIKAYIIADIPFDLIMAVNTVVTFWFLYIPLVGLFIFMYNRMGKITDRNLIKK